MRAHERTMRKVQEYIELLFNHFMDIGTYFISAAACLLHFFGSHSC